MRVSSSRSVGNAVLLEVKPIYSFNCLEQNSLERLLGKNAQLEFPENTTCQYAGNGDMWCGKHALQCRRLY